MADENDSKTPNKIARWLGAMPHLPSLPAPKPDADPSARPPIEYLLASSERSLESFELAHLAHASNLRKEIREMEDQARRAEISAGIARWLREHRDELLRLER